MTGYGAGQAPLADGTLQIELRAVNHRHLDLKVRCVEPLDVVPLIEEQLRAVLVRGHVEAQVRWNAPAARSGPLDEGRAREAYVWLSALGRELAPGREVPFEAVLAFPGVVGRASVVVPERRDQEVAALHACHEAIAALRAMRAREGSALKADLLLRAELLLNHVSFIEAQRSRVLTGYRERLNARIGKLLEGSDLAVDPARLAQEVAWLADKSDIAEETTRLSVHLKELSGSAEAGGAVGRKLDFLVQEIGREINTIGSKANDIGIAQRVVEMKAELERIREQVQNIL